jgi:hypothetical protein
MDLCVGCKGCRRECPTGVDMARMKIEFLHHYRKRHGLRCGPADRLPARYAPYARAAAPLMNLRDRGARPRPAVGAVARLQRAGAPCRAGPPGPSATARCRPPPAGRREVVLLRRHLQPLVRAREPARRDPVLAAAGYRVHPARRRAGARPLCCGRTFLAAGPGRGGARRGPPHCSMPCSPPRARRAVPVVGLEPSCLLTLRDEFPRCCPARRRLALGERLTSRSSSPPRCRAAGCLALKPDAAEPGPAARPLPPEGVRRDGRGARPRCGAVPDLEVRDHRVELLRHGRRLRLRGRALRDLDAPWRSWTCCPRCAPPIPDTSSSPTAPAAATRSRDGAGREALHVARVLIDRGRPGSARAAPRWRHRPCRAAPSACGWNPKAPPRSADARRERPCGLRPSSRPSSSRSSSSTLRRGCGPQCRAQPLPPESSPSCACSSCGWTSCGVPSLRSWGWSRRWYRHPPRPGANSARPRHPANHVDLRAGSFSTFHRWISKVAPFLRMKKYRAIIWIAQRASKVRRAKRDGIRDDRHCDGQGSRDARTRNEPVLVDGERAPAREMLPLPGSMRRARSFPGRFPARRRNASAPVFGARGSVDKAWRSPPAPSPRSSQQTGLDLPG